MKCLIKKFVKVDCGKLPPCFDIIAIGIRSEVDMYINLEDYLYSHGEYLPPKFEKRLCPPTIAQAEELEKKCITDNMGNVIGSPVFIRLMSYEWKTPFSFYKVNPNSVTGVYETIKREIVNEEIYENGRLITVKVSHMPRVLSSIKLTLFETADGKCAENGGNADELCEKIFSNAIVSGAFLPQNDAVDVKDVVEYDEKWECEDDKKYDAWKDYYNWGYYNDGLDMDQQNERFWDF